MEHLCSLLSGMHMNSYCPFFVFLTPEKIGDSLVLPFTNLIVSAVCLTLEKLTCTGTVANSTEAFDDTDGFLLECLDFVPIFCSLESAVLVSRTWRDCRGSC